MNEKSQTSADNAKAGSSLILQSRSVDKINRIILHIGTRKTGSTSLQNRLRENQNILLEQGFKLVVERGQPFKKIFLDIRSGNESWMNLVGECLADAKEHEASNLIISSEDLFYLNEWKIAELITYCKAHAKKVEVYGFFRRQDDYIESSYTQYTTGGIWVGNIQNDFESFLKATIPNIDYKYRIDKWVAACGKRYFKPTFYVQANTTEIFLKKIGLNLPEENPDGLRNKRKPVDLLRGTIFVGERMADHYGFAKHSFSDLNRHFDFRGKIRRPLSRACEKNTMGEGKYCFLTNQNMKIIEYEFMKMNEEIMNEFKGNYDERFADFSRTDRQLSYLSVEHMNNLTIEALMDLLSCQLAELGRKG